MPTYARGGTEEDRAAFNRRSMLNAVTATWIDGVLKRSILRQIMIRLGLESRPDMLRDPWDLVIEHQGSSQVLGPETSLRDLMYQNRGLLILGEPGAGKTTLLLELLKELVEQAENDRTMPIPVVFKLETWKTADHLAGWLIDQLSGERYGVARDIAEQWVINSRVLPLLDGLDEVSLDQRLECARAIDKFHAENSLLPIVVTSRIADYESLALKLALGAAVAVQPLTSSQVEDYLDRIGEPFSGLRSALHSDPLLWELMRTPFFLGIAVATYEGKEAVELFANTSIDDRRTQLIAAFVERSLSRKPSQRSYDPRRAAQWLSVLARALGMRFETVFFIESVDANWLSLPWRRLVIGTISTLSGIIDGLTIYFILKLFMTGYVPVIAGTISGLCFTLLSYFLRTDEGNPVIHFEGGKHGTVLASKLGCWVSATVPIALICGLMGGVIGAIFGAIMSPITGAPFFADVERYCIIWTLCGAVLPLGAMAVLGGEDSSRKDLQQRPTGKDLRDAIWLSFALSLCLGVPAFIVFGGWYGPNGVIAGAAVAVSAGYLYSGSGILGYWLTNLRLAQTGTAPFKKVRFLNYAVSRMLMYKVGGGYMFAHRLMLEYFAYLDHGDTSDRPLYHSLPSVDLRPETVLEHARNDATNGKINLVKALTYAGTYLPAKEFSSGAWDIAMTIEGEVRKFLIDAGRAYQLSYTPEFSIKLFLLYISSLSAPEILTTFPWRLSVAEKCWLRLWRRQENLCMNLQ